MLENDIYLVLNLTKWTFNKIKKEKLRKILRKSRANF